MSDELLEYAARTRSRTPPWRIALYGAVIGIFASVGAWAFEEFSSVESYLPGCLIAGPILLLLSLIDASGVGGAVAYFFGVTVLYAIYALLVEQGRVGMLIVCLFHGAGTVVAYLMLQ